MMSSNRRRFLSAAALSAGSLFLGNVFPRRALAQAKKQRFLFAYFDGGWDQLLGLDPRDPATTTAAANQIDLGWDQLGGVYQARGLQRAGSQTFGPAFSPDMLPHAADFSVIHGIGMDTASHEVGRRYFITGRFPRGLQAVGSSTPAEIATQLGDLSPIPHVSAGVESFADGVPNFATALTVNSIADLLVALTPFTQIDPGVVRAVQLYQDEQPGCVSKKLDRDGLASTLLANQQRARSYLEQQLGEIFNLQRTDAEMNGLRTLYNIGGGDSTLPNSPEVMAFVAAQALKKEVSQCVSVRVADGLDTHSNWAQDQPPRQERGWRALASLVSDLKATPEPNGGGQSMFDNTTILVFSEFGRTPMFNNLRGRDHFLGNSCLVAGPGLKRGLTVGKSADIGQMPLTMELATGRGVGQPTAEEISSGRVVNVSPKHVIATLLRANGLDPSYLRSDPIGALLA